MCFAARTGWFSTYALIFDDSTCIKLVLMGKKNLLHSSRHILRSPHIIFLPAAAWIFPGKDVYEVFIFSYIVNKYDLIDPANMDGYSSSAGLIFLH